MGKKTQTLPLGISIGSGPHSRPAWQIARRRHRRRSQVGNRESIDGAAAAAAAATLMDRWVGRWVGVICG